MTVLALDALSVTIDGRTLVDGVSLAVAAGECVALVGASGSGKTLTAMTPFGLSAGQAAGSARLEGVELVGLDERPLARLRAAAVGFVWQQPLTALTPHRTIGATMAEAAMQAGGARPSRAALADMLARVGLNRPDDMLAMHPHRLSGGERQRVVIAAAIAHRPRLLVADEPTTALDAVLRGEIMALLDRLRREDGLAMLLISHDLASVAAHADRLVVLQDGRVVESGPVGDVLAAPRHAYSRALIAATPRLGSAVVPAARPASAPPMLTVTGAQVSFRRPGWRRGMVRAVDGVDLTLAAGEALALVGGSGSGKSTLGRAIAGIGPLDAGSVTWGGDPLPPRARRTRAQRRLIQPVFQDPVASLDRRWRVSDIIAEPLIALRPDLTAGERGTRVADALAAVDLPPEFATRRPPTLSGGQAQRVAIARAIVSEPAMLLLDEATSALDVLVAASIIALLARLRAERGLAILWITHDLAAAAMLCDRIAVLDQGRIVEQGAMADVVAAPRHAVTRALVAASR